ncbi:hypothetical protein J6590_051611 [Homalodisca vitripennis]|nr:hypothetical protein J6590_051611 [Homalodisca vitripennis]
MARCASQMGVFDNEIEGWGEVDVPYLPSQLIGSNSNEKTLKAMLGLRNPFTNARTGGLLESTGSLSGHTSKQQLRLPLLIRSSCDNSCTRYTPPLPNNLNKTVL